MGVRWIFTLLPWIALGTLPAPAWAEPWRHTLRWPHGALPLEPSATEWSITFAPGLDSAAHADLSNRRIVLGDLHLEPLGPAGPEHERTVLYRAVGEAPSDPWATAEALQSSLTGVTLVTPRLATPGGELRTALPRILLAPRDDVPSHRLVADLRAAGWRLRPGGPTGSGTWVVEPSGSGPLPEHPLDTVESLWTSGLYRWVSVDWLVPKAARWVPPDPLFTNEWHLQNLGQGGGTVGVDLDVVRGWDRARGAGVTLAVLDGGIDPDHPDLSSVLLPGWDVLDGDTDTDPDGLGGHGTSVAGIAAAPANLEGIAGACPECSILPVRMLGASDAGEAEAFDFAVERGAWVINNSWGPIDGTGNIQPLPFVVSDAIERAVREGREGLGTAIVWASGNGAGIDSCSDDGYASDPRVWMVGAVTNLGIHAVYSESCPELDLSGLSAGGTLGIQTTRIDGYRPDFGGTSAAAPGVSGAAAVVLSALPALDLPSLHALLTCSARRLDEASGAYDETGHSDRYGYGLVQLGTILDGGGDCLLTARSTAACEDEVPVLLARPGVLGEDPIPVFSASTAEPEGQWIVLNPTDGALWSGTLRVTAGAVSPDDGALTVAHGDSVSLGLDGGLTGASLRVDCVAPELLTTSILETGPTHGRLGWTTDEPSTGEISWSLPVSGTVLDGSLSVEHDRWLFDLEPCTDYVVDLQTLDVVGNAAAWPSAYTFRTAGDPGLVPEGAPDDADPCDPASWLRPDDGIDLTPAPPDNLSGDGNGCDCEGGESSMFMWLALPLARRRRRPC